MKKEENEMKEGDAMTADDKDSGTGGSHSGSRASLKSDKSASANSGDPGGSQAENTNQNNDGMVVENVGKRPEETPRAKVNLLTGPVIGHVTSTTAIILLEIDADVDNFDVILRQITQDDTVGVQFKETREVKARSPTVFHFKKLPPKSAFNVIAPVISRMNIGMVRTLPTTMERLNLAFVSCDRHLEENGYDHWGKLWKRVNADQLYIIVHLGDNVYLDESASAGLSNEEMVAEDWTSPDKKDIPYVKARKILHDTPKDQWNTKIEEIREIYREQYRKTWRRPNTRKILATISNLMICDDHEFRDNFGSVKEDRDPGSAEFFLGLQALRVYHEYQRQLWDPNILTRGHANLANEFFCLTFGNFGIMMTETRTMRSVYYSQNLDDDTYFGKKQLEAIKAAFNSNSQVKMWCFCTTMPLLFIKKKLVELGNKIKPDAAEDSLAMMQAGHDEELSPLLHLFHDWKSNHPGNEFVIVNGDVHIGGFTDVLVKTELDNGDVVRELVCRQLTASAISNKITWLQYAVLRTALTFTEDIGAFTYKHYDWTNDYNFMILNIDDLGFAPHYVVKQFHGPKGAVAKDSKDRHWDLPYGAPPSGCCTLL